MQHHEQFMHFALAEATSALKEGDFPVGCVLVEDEQVLASGRRQNSSGDYANELDHAEVMTLRDLLQKIPGHDLSKITAYSTMEPCLMCFSTLLLSGVRKFVWAYEDIMGGATNLPIGQLNTLYSEMDIHIVPYVLRTQSLALFQDFFRRYSYWAESPLARYTLEQNPQE